MNPDQSVAPEFPADFVRKYGLVPIVKSDESLTCAGSKSPGPEVLEELEFILQKPVEIELWSEAQIRQRIELVYGLDFVQSTRSSPSNPVDEKSPNPRSVSLGTNGHAKRRSVVGLIDSMFEEALQHRASDIHLEPQEHSIRLRYRIDGKLVERDRIESAMAAPLVSRLKIMADLDIAEKRRPQDGHIQLSSESRPVDVRVSTLATRHGEKVVMRLLERNNQGWSLDSLGLETELNTVLRRSLKLANGMVLVTGPTGCGKTTTLYAALNYLNSDAVNITTIEDPIEYHLDGVNQTMVNAEIGLTFAEILRTLLRQDPDICMVGEIRDRETAEIAVRAALTGHLVLSTLHTNDAISTVIRLIDMGIEPFLVTSSLKLVIAQRLVRCICQSCRVADELGTELSKGYDLPEWLRSRTMYVGKGCPRCNGTGYSGRRAIMEYVEIDEDLAAAVVSGVSLGGLRDAIRKRGNPSLWDAGLRIVAAGETSLSEVIAIASV